MSTTAYQIIAVDFDGTLCYSNWPELGEPNRPLIEYLIDQKKSGNKLILWTCRAGEALEKAVSWCREHQLEFDAIMTISRRLSKCTATIPGRSPAIIILMIRLYYQRCFKLFTISTTDNYLGIYVSIGKSINNVF